MPRVSKRPPQPRKRFRRRGPGLLTTDTDLQKRLTSLMRDTNSDELLFRVLRDNRDTDEERDKSEIPFDRTVLERLPEKTSLPSAAATDEEETSAAGEKDEAESPGKLKPGNDSTSAGASKSNLKSKELLMIASSPRKERADAAHKREASATDQDGAGNEAAKRLRTTSGTASSMPAFLRRKVNGRASLSRLMRRRHFRTFQNLLYDFPKQDDGDGENDDKSGDDEDDDDDEEQQHGALGMLLGAAEVMKKQERGSKRGEEAPESKS